MRHFKVVIRNLHHTTILSDISDALAEHGHSVIRVVNIRKNQRPLPFFHVELALKNNNHNIFNISTLLHSIVVIEKPHSTINDPPQCFKCQAYGHTRNYCCHSLDASNVVTTISQRIVPKTGHSRLNALCVLVIIQPRTKNAQFARNWYYQINFKRNW
jgi:hypothetical protein